MILVSKFMVHRALSDKTYLSLGLLSPLIKTDWNIFRMSNDLDPDQDRRSVGPDLVPNCLQTLSLVAASKEFDTVFVCLHELMLYARVIIFSVKSGRFPDQY